MCCYLLRYRTHLGIVPTNIGNVEVTAGGGGVGFLPQVSL